MSPIEAARAFLFAMPDRNALLESVKGRHSRCGIVTADRYFRDIERCFDGGFCPVKLTGAASSEQWQKALKEAERQLTYCHPRMRLVQRSMKKAAGSLMEFEAIVTTTHRDRDGDVLESRGAVIDKQAPLLAQHMPMMPIGKFLRTIKRTDSFVKARFGIVDTELGSDYAKLARYGALRISHGFDPKQWEPMEDEQGWHFLKFDIFEVSLVSIPSNVEAVITSVSKHKWASELVKGWADRMVRTPQALVPEDVRGDIQSRQREDFEAGRMPKLELIKRHDLIIRKEFDVERQHLEAARLEYDWISRFCSCEVKQLVNQVTHAARIRMGSFLTGLRHALRDSKEIDARRLTSSGNETPLEYETIQLNSTKSGHFLVDGISFRKTADGTCFTVKFVRTWSGERVEVFSTQKDHGKVSHLLGEA